MRAYSICVSALVVALSGCGSSSSDSPDDTGSPTTPGTGSPTTPGEGDTPASGGPATGDDALITPDSYEEILRQVIAVANDEVLDAASESLAPLFGTVADLAGRSNADGAASGNGLAFVSRELATNGGTNDYDFTFSCDGGGTLVANAYYDENYDEGLPQVQELTFGDTCVVDGDSHDGVAYRVFRPTRGTDIERYDGFSITRADGSTLTLDGDYSDSRPEGMGIRIAYGWTGAGHVADDGGSTLRLDGYTSLRESIDGFGCCGGGDNPLTVALPDGRQVSVREAPYGATANVAFSVTAPWSSDERLDATLELNIADDRHEFTGIPADGGPAPDYPLSDLGSPIVLTNVDTGVQTSVINTPVAATTQWQSGSLTISAADGSTLVLSPETGDPATFSVTLDGEPAPILRDWSDGFQVNCPEPIVCR